MPLDSKYLPNIFEKEIISKQSKSFMNLSRNKSRDFFTILLPPPNVTGNLHLGHALNGYLQDFLIRHNMLKGKTPILIPGMDHAGIATQAKVEKELFQKENKRRSDYTREEFFNIIWDWKEDSAENIRRQWKKAGFLLNYDKEYFTLDENIKQTVKEAFITLYKKGLIYRDYKLVNWDTELNTAISNIEIEYKEQESTLYDVRYQIKGSKEYIVVSTTRPETIFADVAVFANPKDKRYAKYKNTKVINPLNGNEMPIMFDEYVDKSFGTGLMKCTPGHDFNDFDLGKKYKLESLTCINYDGKLNDLAGEWKGIDRLKGRKEIGEWLSKKGKLESKKTHINNVNFSQRSGTIVEPLLSLQWFFDTKSIAKDILKNQKTPGKVNFIPKRFEKNFKMWLENIEEWCISRQLWWGHRIPVWYHKDDKNKIFCDSLEPIDSENWIRDDDVLDTWFSSGLLPFALSETHGYRDYLPINTIVTGYDIIFFWIARMYIFNIELDKTIPFENVLVHGIVRDEQNRKMSKSLGNGIDPIELINEYGSDSLRWFLITSSAPGEDIRFNLEKIRNAWNFNNKVWNVSKFIEMNFLTENKSISKLDFDKVKKDVNKWILSEYDEFYKKHQKNVSKYEFAILGNEIYKFTWDTFCNKYIELIKGDTSEETRSVTLYVFKEILILLNPFNPLVTEKILQSLFNTSIFGLKYRAKSIKIQKYDSENINKLFLVLEAVRNHRKNNQMKFNDEVQFCISDKDLNSFITPYCEKLLNAKNTYSDDAKLNWLFLTSDDKSTSLKIAIKEKQQDKKQILVELKKQLLIAEQEKARIVNMFKNESFMMKAPKEKIELEKAKLTKFEDQIKELTIKIKSIKE